VRRIKPRRGFALLAQAAFAIALSSCAGVEPNEAASPPISCSPGVDCDRKWSRAATWVAQNAFYKIETRSDWLIQTFGPEGKSPGTAMKVEKLAAPDGSVELVLQIRCANFLGCVPDLDWLTGSFLAYVGGTSRLIVAIPPPPKHTPTLPLLGNPLAIFQ
jgi:hypothetical protein